MPGAPLKPFLRDWEFSGCPTQAAFAWVGISIPKTLASPIVTICFSRNLATHISMDYCDPQVAEIYDLANSPAQDTDFYLSLAEPRPCSILDLGCGTGTLCCALAERGHQPTGVDPAAAVLAVARRKPHAESVEWVGSSAENYRSDRCFDWIFMTGHAFQVLLSNADALAVFATMHRHLKPRGKVAFETRNPSIDWASEWAKHPIRKLAGNISEEIEMISHDGEFISFRTTYRLPDTTLTTNSTLRFPSREHIQDLMARSGLAIATVFGDWDRTPFEPSHSREMIFIAEPAR